MPHRLMRSGSTGYDKCWIGCRRTNLLEWIYAGTPT
jgi:hypothetical protein